MSYNKVLILGNVGREPEVRHLEGGLTVANFTVATTEYYTDRNNVKQERVEWHRIECWRKLADLTEKYIRKGTQVFIEGKIRSREYTDNTGATKRVYEILADTIQLLGKKADNDANMGGYQPQQQYQQYQQPQQPQQPQQQYNQAAPSGGAPVSDMPQSDIIGGDNPADDLPF